ncbi:MAG TPA: NAD-dependent epimerase/dehydratase family protein [Solirubrobacteraceae bacterium]|nr:NAD-dependent epimerase/dehydratase family protein [Solirubrobacteraceae bacterium]
MAANSTPGGGDSAKPARAGATKAGSSARKAGAGKAATKSKPAKASTAKAVTSKAAPRKPAPGKAAPGKATPGKAASRKAASRKAASQKAAGTKAARVKAAPAKAAARTRARPAERSSGDGLTVVITGPTGEMGQSVVRSLERSPEVGRILGMARRPFDPASRGWKKVSYRRGDVLDRRRVANLIEDADVVVHLAFIIMGSAKESRRVNLRGSRNVFEAAANAGVKRLVYASSVAAYGFHADNPQPLTEDVPARGTAAHYYSAQKAEVEELLADALHASGTASYVFRPSIVGGPEAPLLIDSLPYTQISERLPGPVMSLLDGVPILKPVLPDPGVPFQLVHHDDVASAMRAAVLGRGEPGVYNLAGAGELTVKGLAEALGWYSIPVPDLAVDAIAQLIARLGFLPAQAQWIAAFREPVLMDTSKARRLLGWRPRHDAAETLAETITASRMDNIIR